MESSQDRNILGEGLHHLIHTRAQEEVKVNCPFPLRAAESSTSPRGPPPGCQARVSPLPRLQPRGLTHSPDRRAGPCQPSSVPPREAATFSLPNSHPAPSPSEQYPSRVPLPSEPRPRLPPSSAFREPAASTRVCAGLRRVDGAPSFVLGLHHLCRGVEDRSARLGLSQVNELVTSRTRPKGPA